MLWLPIILCISFSFFLFHSLVISATITVMLISNPTPLFPTSDQVPTSTTCKDPGHCNVIFIISNYLLDNVNDLTMSVPQYSERI